MNAKMKLDAYLWVLTMNANAKIRAFLESIVKSVKK